MSSPKSPDRFCYLPSCPFVVYRRLFSTGQSGMGVKLTNPRLVPMLGIVLLYLNSPVCLYGMHMYVTLTITLALKMLIIMVIVNLTVCGEASYCSCYHRCVPHIIEGYCDSQSA
jgi:hypothetical protein